jgi:LPXTG-motif cell wall-anchored protein
VRFHGNGGLWEDGGVANQSHPTTNPAGNMQVRTNINHGTSLSGTANNAANAMPRVITDTPNNMVFVGWYQRVNGAYVGPRWTSTMNVNHSMDLYARWMPAHLVTFNGNGHTSGRVFFDTFNPLPIANGFTAAEMHAIWGNSFVQPVTSPTAVGNLPFNNQRYNLANIDWDPARTAATLINLAQGRWNTEAAGFGDVFDQNTAVTGNITVYAQWIARLTFNSNRVTVIPNANDWSSNYDVIVGRSFSNHHTHSATSNTPLQFPTPGIGAWLTLGTPGWVLIGWNTQPDGSGIFYNAHTVTTGPNPARRLYAIWSQEIVFDSGIAPPSVIADADRTRDFNATPGVLGVLGNNIPNPVWPGHYFIGWNTQRDGSGATINPHTFDFIQPTRVYAQWQARLIFDPNGGTHVNPMRTSSVVHTTPQSVGQAAFNWVGTPTKSGHNFIGWNTQPTGTGQAFDASSTIAQTTTVFARWDRYLSLTTAVTPMGAGSISANVSPIYTGETHIVTATANPGWLFSHWVVTGTTNYTIGNSVTVTVQDEDIHVVAHFVVDPDSILRLTTAVTPAGAGTISNGINPIYTGEMHTITAIAAVGWILYGWEVSGAADYAINGNSVEIEVGTTNVHVLAIFVAVDPGPVNDNDNDPPTTPEPTDPPTTPEPTPVNDNDNEIITENDNDNDTTVEEPTMELETPEEPWFAGMYIEDLFDMGLSPNDFEPGPGNPFHNAPFRGDLTMDDLIEMGYGPGHFGNNPGSPFNPQTGDNANFLFVTIGIIGFVMSGLVAVLAAKRRKKVNA